MNVRPFGLVSFPVDSFVLRATKHDTLTTYLQRYDNSNTPLGMKYKLKDRRSNKAQYLMNARHTIRETATMVVRTLQQAGHIAYFAGGCVRDELIGCEPVDYDIATDAKPDTVRRLFRNTRAVGEHFGVILVHQHGYSIQVATFRIEAGYSDKRHPDTVHFSDARHDATRRDFTINGMFKDPITNQIIDYVNGQKDLDNRIIRAIGKPDDRLAEDHLRALRAVRFAARFGFTIDKQTQQAICEHAGKLRGVSQERIGMEVRMMMQHESRVYAINLLQSLHLDAPVLNSEHLDAALIRLEVVSRADCTKGDMLQSQQLQYATALAAWVLDRGEDIHTSVSRWRRALVLTNKETSEFRMLLSIRERLSDNWAGNFSVAQKKRLSSKAMFSDCLAILHSENPGFAGEVEQEVNSLRLTPSGLSPKPYLTGRDLIAMGFKPGPAFKDAIDTLYDAQLEDKIASIEEAHSLAMELLTQ